MTIPVRRLKRINDALSHMPFSATTTMVHFIYTSRGISIRVIAYPARAQGWQAVFINVKGDDGYLYKALVLDARTNALVAKGDLHREDDHRNRSHVNFSNLPYGCCLILQVE